LGIDLPTLGIEDPEVDFPHTYRVGSFGLEGHRPRTGVIDRHIEDHRRRSQY
jgi:hypothetical protein